MSLSKPRGPVLGGLSLRGFAWSVGVAFITVEAGMTLIPVLVLTVFAYVKGA
jgi:hypothetical protein